jgi:hypothetical protein
MSVIEGFIAELADLGYQAEALGPEHTGGDGGVAFDYEIEVGPQCGTAVRLALQVPSNWPLSPPSGPFVSPHLLPIFPQTGKGRPWDGVHDGHGRGLALPEGEWQYWSRPFPPGWGTTEKTVDVYLRHLRTLFAELPAEDAGEARIAA